MHASQRTPGTGDATTFTGDPNADADHDGLTARMEYALGTSDTTPNTAPPLQVDPRTATVTFERSCAADDAVPLLETSADLTTWTTTWNLTRRINLMEGREQLTFTAPPGTAGQRAYLRLRVP